MAKSDCNGSCIGSCTVTCNWTCGSTCDSACWGTADAGVMNNVPPFNHRFETRDEFHERLREYRKEHPQTEEDREGK